MTVDLARLQDDRARLLHKLWEKTLGNTNSVYPLSELGEELELNSMALRDAAGYLRNEGLIKGIDHMQITQAGVREVEAKALAQDRAQRFDFLKALHSATGGKALTFRNVWKLGEGSGLTESDIRKVKLNLEQGGLIKMGLYGDDACLTAEGIRAIEEEFGMAKSSSPNISVAIGAVHGGQVMVASDGSTQTLTQTAGVDLKDLGPFLAQVAASLDKLGLSADDRQAVEADIQTAEAQLKSSKPRTSLLRDVIVSIREALVKAAGTATVSYAQAELPKLIDQAQHLLAGLGG